MNQLGAHMSIAGGYYKAADAAAALEMNTVQVFTKNNNQWKGKELSDKDVSLFRDAIKQHGLKRPIAHASYLINLASPDAELWQKSVDAMIVEIWRADRLGIPWVVVHPGAFTKSSEEAGIAQIGRALNEVDLQTKGADSACLLENTAGQGSCLGWKFEQLAAMIDLLDNPDRIGVCLDTCHAFAAGYEMETDADFRRFVKSINSTIGMTTIKALHLNDSKKPLGSRVDRHEGIGLGEMGLEPFRHMVNHHQFRKIPGYLETPKGIREEDGAEWDAVNLATLRGLIESKG